MKRVATLFMTLVLVLFFSKNAAYACECGCECAENEKQTMETEKSDGWEDAIREETITFFPNHNFFFRNVFVEDLDEKKVIEMETFSFLREITGDNRLLIEFYPPGDIGSRLDSADYIEKEDAIRLGESEVYAWGYWNSVSYLHTGEMIFEIPIDEETSVMFFVYETPMGWTMELSSFEEPNI